MEIWEECSIFKTTTWRLPDQGKMIIKKVWFSDLEILEIHQQINRDPSQQGPTGVIETLNTEKQDPFHRTES